MKNRLTNQRYVCKKNTVIKSMQYCRQILEYEDRYEYQISLFQRMLGY